MPGVLLVLAAGCVGPNDNTWPSDYAHIYSRPLLSPGAQFAATPPAVQNTIRAQTGSTAIDKITKETSGDQVFYRIDFVNPVTFPPLFIAADGSLLDPDLHVLIPAPPEKESLATASPGTTVLLGDLPPPVVRTIQLQAPDSEVASISKETHRDQTTYFVTFKDHRHDPLHLASDGTILP